MMSLREIRVVLWAKPGSDLAVIEESLARVGCKVLRVSTFYELEKICLNHEADLLVISCQDARYVLQWLNASTWNAEERIPVLTLASSLDVDLYLETMQLGAFDCAGLPLDSKELARLITRAVDSAHVAAHA
ncbi:MAG: hypothetical protein ACRD5G_12625 [Candidatus Acidiferrales bacterium]